MKHRYWSLIDCADMHRSLSFVSSPQGWWHYALALDDDNVTVMRNFYHAKTNANGLVKMAVDAIAKRKRGAAAKG